MMRSFGIHLTDVMLATQKIELQDAVVIRRQDKFASPCLLTYAAMISMVATNHGDEEVGKELQKIADYFQEQGELAGEEGWKLPDL
jgi:hypothetical protein